MKPTKLNKLQTISLNEMSLTEMSIRECHQIYGGGVMEELGKLVGAAVHYVVNGVEYASENVYQFYKQTGSIRPSEYR